MIGANEVKVYTVKQLSDLAGVSIRTLHYYDEIGLLKPESVGANLYRHYGDQSLIRLQQILFYRELGLSLDEIQRIITRPDFDVLSALESHRQALQARRERLDRLIHMVDDTLLHLKGKKEMSKHQLFAGFSEEEQEQYAKEAAERYDPETVKASNKKWKQYTPQKQQAILADGNAIYEHLVAVMPKGPSSPEAQAGIDAWRRHLEYFWVPNDQQLLGLVDLYNTDPRFVANFNKIDARLGAFMKAAVKVYVEKKKG